MSLRAGPTDGGSPVTVWSLEMTRPTELRPAEEPAPAPTLVHARRPAPELSRFFYRSVGGNWYWVDRLDWTMDDWLRWVDRPDHELWTAWLDGCPVGYFELDQQPEEAVEVAFFGLLAAWHGAGLGGWLLTEALRRAWSLPDVRRVWVHTCTLDGPAALTNYEARGLRRYAETTEFRDLSAPSPGPWRGSAVPPGPATVRPR